MFKHSLSAVHPRQVLVDVAQMGVVPPAGVVVRALHAGAAGGTGRDSGVLGGALGGGGAGGADLVRADRRSAEHPALVRHWTHLFAVVSQTGVLPEQVLLSMHATHCPALVAAGCTGRGGGVLGQTLAGRRAGGAAVVRADGRGRPSIPRWSGTATHLLVAVSQTGVLPEQVLLSVHWTQVPLAEQAGAAGFLAETLGGLYCRPCRRSPRRWAVALNTLRWSGTPRHLLVVVSQTGVVPEQVLLSMHCRRCRWQSTRQ